MNERTIKVNVAKDADNEEREPENSTENTATADDSEKIDKADLEQVDDVSVLKKELDEMRDRWLRATADLDNFKKRAAKEREDWTRYSQEKLLKDFIVILDNLERAIDHFETGRKRDDPEVPEALVEGIRMTQRLFLTTLERYGVTPIDAVNRPFDPASHDAMMQVESDEHDPNTVIQEAERGYYLHDRLLRPTKVIVSKTTES